MTEKTDWEVVDAPSPNTRPPLRQLMKKLLGRWWRWKLGGAAVLAGLAVAFFAAVIGVIVVVMIVGVILSLGVNKIRRWLHHGRASTHPTHPVRRRE